MLTYCFSCIWKRFPGLFATSSFQGSMWGYLVCGFLDPSSCPCTNPPFPPAVSLIQCSNFSLTTVKCQVAAASQNTRDLSGQDNMWWACACWFPSFVYDTVPRIRTERLKSPFYLSVGQRISQSHSLPFQVSGRPFGRTNSSRCGWSAVVEGKREAQLSPPLLCQGQEPRWCWLPQDSCPFISPTPSPSNDLLTCLSKLFHDRFPSLLNTESLL